MTRLSEAELDRFADLSRKEGTVVVFACDLSDLVDELRERRAAEKQPPNTAKVRIGVATWVGEGWDARGSESADDEQVRREFACIHTDSDYRITFVTAFVPLPEPPAEVAGTVEVGE